jgi:predicted nucleotide-binding protein
MAFTKEAPQGLWYPPTCFRDGYHEMSLAAITNKLDELVKDGLRCESLGDYDGWSQRATEFLRKALDGATAKEFSEMSGYSESWWIARGQQVGMLEGIAAFRSDSSGQPDSAGSSAPAPIVASKRVFLVHGHDSDAKQTVARFLERLGLEPIILHEQANEGRTVIEKIEAFSEVGFAVVLLTPDDVGAAKDDAANVKQRARQNVVLELGYFLGKLRRNRVCALYKTGVEIPSDYQGVLYTELDAKGAWRTSLAQELSNARLPIKLEGLLGS